MYDHDDVAQLWRHIAAALLHEYCFSVCSSLGLESTLIAGTWGRPVGRTTVEVFRFVGLFRGS